MPTSQGGGPRKRLCIASVGGCCCDLSAVLCRRRTGACRHVFRAGAAALQGNAVPVYALCHFQLRLSRRSSKRTAPAYLRGVVPVCRRLLGRRTGDRRRCDPALAHGKLPHTLFRRQPPPRRRPICPPTGRIAPVCRKTFFDMLRAAGAAGGPAVFNAAHSEQDASGVISDSAPVQHPALSMSFR